MQAIIGPTLLSSKMVQPIPRLIGEAPRRINRRGVHLMSWRILLRGQALDDRALRVLGVGVAIGNQPGEFPAQVTQLSDASINEAQLGGGELACRMTRAPLLQLQKARDLDERKSHGLRALDEP